MTENKARWIAFKEWWVGFRQAYEPMPMRSLRAFKKGYNTCLKQECKEWKKKRMRQGVK